MARYCWTSFSWIWYGRTIRRQLYSRLSWDFVIHLVTSFYSNLFCNFVDYFIGDADFPTMCRLMLSYLEFIRLLLLWGNFYLKYNNLMLIWIKNQFYQNFKFCNRSSIWWLFVGWMGLSMGYCSYSWTSNICGIFDDSYQFNVQIWIISGNNFFIFRFHQ